MNENVSIGLSLLAGLGLGFIFFTILRLTVSGAVTARAPWLLLTGSFIFRSAIVLTGFYFVGSGNWRRLVLCLLGFIIARVVVVYNAKPVGKKILPEKMEVVYEN